MVDMWTIWEMTVGPYTNQLGSFFWLFVTMLPTAVVYVRSRDFGPTFMVFAVVFMALYPVLPAGTFWGGAYVIVALGIAYSLYRFLIKDLMRG